MSLKHLFVLEIEVLKNEKHHREYFKATLKPTETELSIAKAGNTPAIKLSSLDF